MPTGMGWRPCRDTVAAKASSADAPPDEMFHPVTLV